MKKKKKNNLFWIILIGLFIMFIGLYIANATGYYESKMAGRVKLTNESIKRFENDIAAGKNVTLEDYLEEESKDYSNKASKLGLKFSKATESIMADGLGSIFKILGKLFS